MQTSTAKALNEEWDIDIRKYTEHKDSRSFDPYDVRETVS